MDISKIKYCILRVWKPGEDHPASDGSTITKQVWDEYLASPKYRENIEANSCLGTLTHSSRDNKNMGTEMSSNLPKCIGKDDLMLMIESHRAPVWVLKEIFYDPRSDWYCARMEILDETYADKDMKENILRLKSLLAQGIKLGISAVIVAYWDSADKGGFGQARGNDVCKKIINVKSFDVTMNNSFPGARVTDVLDEEGNSIFGEEKTFSEVEREVLQSGVPVVKTFSDPEEFKSLPRTSKVGLSFTKLKVKEFSCISDATPELLDTTEKTFSVGQVKERVRYMKMGPRQCFRRIIMDYKQAYRQAGNAKPEEIEIMKSLFASDILTLVKQIHPDILKGKQIATLLGASSISKSARQSCQRLQLPYRMAMQQMEKQGFITKDRYQKIQTAYTEFVKSLIEEVFGSPSLGTNIIEDENLEEED